MFVSAGPVGAIQTKSIETVAFVQPQEYSPTGRS